MSAKTGFAEDWITSGWTRDTDGQWVECGHSAAIRARFGIGEPELKIHDIAGRLNELERQLELAEAFKANFVHATEIFKC